MNLSDEKILIIDDNADVLQTFVHTLTSQNKGCHITGYRDARKALERMKEEHFDVILFDHDLLCMVGDEFYTQARELNDMAVYVCITGSEIKNKRYAVIQKPFDLADLSSTIEQEKRKETLNETN